MLKRPHASASFLSTPLTIHKATIRRVLVIVEGRELEVKGELCTTEESHIKVCSEK